MPTPKQGYYLADGTRIPGTTTIIGRFKDSGALIQWAYKQGREHEALARQGKEAPARLYETVEKAADIGTASHALVEAHIRGAEGDEIFSGPDYQSLDEASQRAARDAYGAYLSWEGQSKLKIIEQEIQLVSEEFRFGGTPDAIGQINGEYCLLDWKTSNNVYTDHLIQLAAYNYLWNENNPDRQITGGSHLCRFAKTHGDFAHNYYPNLDEGWELFKLYRKAYDLDKQLKKRA